MKIKNWKKFQHFKDRKPPWIKLYRDILDDVDINMISDRCFRVIIMLWLIASEDPSREGNLPALRKLAFRLRMSEATLVEIIKGLTEFIEFDDIDLISTRYQHDTPETETETEIETENKHHLSDSIGRDDVSKTSTDGCHEQKKAKTPRRPKKAIVYDPAIIAIYEAYPKKVGRAVALASIQSAIERGHAADAILEATKAYAASPMVQTTELQFIPNPSTFFNQDRFLDDRSNWNQVRSNGSERQGGGMVACVDDGISDGYESMFGSVNF
jgi:hypothetical protein